MKILSRKVSIVRSGTLGYEQKVMYLSGADHFVRPRHVPLFLFYQAREGGETLLPTEVLLKSLKELLIRFPPLSGRLRQKANTSSKFELFCNDAGVEFVEATTDSTISDLGDFQPNRLHYELLGAASIFLRDVFECPILYAQVTRFACGGAVLVVSFLHTIMDGRSFNQVVTSWSELARGLEISNPLFLDRTLLKTLKGPDPYFELKALSPIGNIAANRRRKDLGDWPAARMFSFSPEQLKKLKSEVSKLGVKRPFSTFECISAHVWQSVTKARCLDSNATTSFFSTLDARRRLKSTLPNGYFGNAICLVSATSTAGQVVNQPMSYAAGLIRDSISGFSDDYMRSCLAYVEHSDQLFSMNMNSEAGQDLYVTNLVGLPVLRMDFGSGKPFLSSPGIHPIQGSVRLHPGQYEGYINVFIYLTPEHMLRLTEDPEFLPPQQGNSKRSFPRPRL